MTQPDNLPAYVSTGSLPPREKIRTLLDEAYARYHENCEGENSRVYPALARACRELFGICITTTDGETCGIGATDFLFSIMSVSKPFVFALICEHHGVQETREKVGVNATGKPFNSLEAIELSSSGLSNPMVNSGAIATTSLSPGSSVEDKWRFIQEGLSRFAGRDLLLNEEIYDCAIRSNVRNREIANILRSKGRLYSEPSHALDLYTRQCSLDVSAKDLSVMGATLAGGGMNPVTGEQVIDSTLCHHVLAVMTIAGLYETSGDWLFDIGLPGKSGISGGIVTSAPGKGGLGVFSPPLDPAGNSVRGQLVNKFLSRHLGLDLFASKPRTRRWLE